MVSLSRTKKTGIIVIILLAMIFLLNGCGPLIPLKTPYDYPNSVWESEAPHVYLHVIDQYSYNAESYIEIDNDKIPVLFYADSKSSYGSVEKKTDDNKSEACLFTMDWKCYSDRIEITIVHDHIFDEQYSTFVMYRTDVQK